MDTTVYLLPQQRSAFHDAPRDFEDADGCWRLVRQDHYTGGADALPPVNGVMGVSHTFRLTYEKADAC